MGGAPPGEAADGGHQLLDPLLLAAGAVPADDAVADVLVEHAEGDAVEGGAHRGDLRQHVDAVAVLLDHPRDAAHLPLDARQAREELVLGGGVAARGGGVHGRSLP